jgi:hypothetical protein
MARNVRQLLRKLSLCVVCVRASGNDDNNNGEGGGSSAGIPAARESISAAQRICAVDVYLFIGIGKLGVGSVTILDGMSHPK